MGRRAGPSEHVKDLRRKYGARAWSLRHLKQAHIPPKTLVRVYCALIRPALEYPSSVYHSLPSNDESESIERLQRMALKIIYGIKVPYQKYLELSGLPRLDERRGELLSAFIARTEQTDRFREAWFKKKKNQHIT